MDGYLQLQNSLSGDISQCPMCLAKPSFVIRSSVIQPSQSVINHHAMVKRGVVVVQFHSFFNLRNRWKWKTGYLRVRAALTLRNDPKILSGHSGEEKNVLYLAGKWNPGCQLVSHHYLDGPTPSIYVMSDEYWANVCNCCCGLPEGEGIFLPLNGDGCRTPRFLRICQASYRTRGKPYTLSVHYRHESIICIQTLYFVYWESYETHE
jgi:hypothetical protein